MTGKHKLAIAAAGALATLIVVTQWNPNEGAEADDYAGGLKLEKLGGVYGFREWNGRAIDQADFTGRWTLLFFGYSRCTTTCPNALPLIARAADKLRTRGVATRAAFVDIEAPPLQLTRRSTGENVIGGHGGHGGHGAQGQRRAMMQIASHYGDRLLVLTGTRGQLAQATIAYSVAREHVPPRPKEEGHSLNHSSYVYVLAPNSRVVGYFDHATPVDDVVDGVVDLNEGLARQPMS